MKITSLDTENISSTTIYKLSKTYTFPNQDPVLQKGFYTENFLKSILKESFEFALKCTDFKDAIQEVSYEEAKKTKSIETPEDKLEVEIPVIEIETPEDKLEVEIPVIEIETPEDKLEVEIPVIEIETPEDNLKVETKNSKKNRRNK